MEISEQAPVFESKTNTRWSQDRRLEFIDFRLRWEGRINRSDITGFFGISVPQASLDIAKYLELAPGNLVYDRSARVYVVTPCFAPVFGTSSSSRFLNELLASESGVLDPESSLVGWKPPVAIVPTPRRTLNAETLAVLMQAIRNRTGVRVLYQSMTNPEPSSRTLTPHAIAHNGFRWHVRAYCHKNGKFQDFVIARILEIEPVESSGPWSDEDKGWQTMVEVVLIPHPKLPPTARKAIELEFDMTDGRARLECRQALLFYLVNYLRLNPHSSEKPEALQIALENRDIVEAYLKNR
jgi:hypothetical protein